ncbi:MAG: histidine ammonia-lyase [Gilvibacter sp.]
MNAQYIIGDNPLDLFSLYELYYVPHTLKLGEKATKHIENSYRFLHEKIAKSDTPIYGINTGFGSLCNVKISKENLGQLQQNLVMSHACGIGDEVPQDIVRLMLLLKIQSLSFGQSGVAFKTVQTLVDLYNNNIIPVVYTQGSLGASGDLAPLAHMSLPLLGMGEVYYEGQKQEAASVLKKLNIEIVNLQAKEGLALLNGTQFMSAYGVKLLLDGYKLSYMADVVGAVSIDAFDCNMSPYDPLVHIVRPHKGQINTAKRIVEFLEGSEITVTEKQSVQDPYSFRCIPQVHGASKDTLDFVAKTIITEVNSVTDNPNIFIGKDVIISGGNFHGQPLALAFDYLAIALSELANISERRTFQLVSGQRGLPAFLVSDPGLNSGFMIPQYTAASIVSQNKQLATPASVDSIVSSNGQEDHVSMGANGATKCYKVCENLKKVIGIELMTASQALSFRKPKRSSGFIESLLTSYREVVPFVSEDQIMSPHIHASKLFIEQMQIEPEELFNS